LAQDDFLGSNHYFVRYLQLREGLGTWATAMHSQNYGGDAAAGVIAASKVLASSSNAVANGSTTSESAGGAEKFSDPLKGFSAEAFLAKIKFARDLRQTPQTSGTTTPIEGSVRGDDFYPSFAAVPFKSSVPVPKLNSTTTGKVTAAATRTATTQFAMSGSTSTPDGASSEEVQTKTPASTAASSEEQAAEKRFGQIEDQLKDINNLIKEQHNNPDGILVLREHARRLGAELEASRQTRKAYEDRLARLETCLKQERDERETWMSTFLTGLQTTLQDLASCVDQSIAESNGLMRGRLDEVDGATDKLIRRCETLFVKEGNVNNTSSISSCATPSSKHNANISINFKSVFAKSPQPSQPSLIRCSESRRSSTGVPAQAESVVLSAVSTASSDAGVEEAETVSSRHSITSTSSASQKLQEAKLAPRTDPLVSNDAVFESWTELLNENLRLQQKKNNLISMKKRVDLVRADTKSPTPGKETQSWAPSSG